MSVGLTRESKRQNPDWSPYPQHRDMAGQTGMQFSPELEELTLPCSSPQVPTFLRPQTRWLTRAKDTLVASRYVTSRSLPPPRKGWGQPLLCPDLSLPAPLHPVPPGSTLTWAPAQSGPRGSSCHQRIAQGWGRAGPWAHFWQLLPCLHRRKLLHPSSGRGTPGPREDSQFQRDPVHPSLAG